MKFSAPSRHFSRALCAAAILGAACGAASAANHALIMSIGTYANPRANLPGIDLDERNAVKIAKTMGVPDANMVFLKDAQASGTGIETAFVEMTKKIARGDNLFIYYTGHGGQRNARTAGAQCTEGMITHDMQLYPDTRIQQVLGDLAAKSGQLVFMNDSCFSGGQAEFRSLAPKSGDEQVGKSFKLENSSVAQTPGYSCGSAINMKMARDIAPLAAKGGANMLYIAAAQDNEVAQATGKGSAATLAWLACLKPETDGNGSGTLSGEEIRTCAQQFLDKNNFNHHITLVGNKQLPLSFAAAQQAPQAGTPAAAVRAQAALQDVLQGSSPEIRVALQVGSPRMKIRQDYLDFAVTTSRPGYLTILQAGSDGKTFNRIFPNDVDTDNLIQAGTVRLPRRSWMLHAGGPAGTSHLMAVVSDTPRDFAKGMTAAGPFRTGTSARDVYSAATGVESKAPGRYGASDVVAIEEY
jgi:hypothetical protein